ncbi:hypothetical protein PFNF135_02832 [Plasmodium falciparum NF135/5.C10]|uniref:Erythrocyte membrane protein 1 n=1 Tax=Plasmodium falciparum NF135/5.C10 TaxID=1036726 RepID=W4IGU3_PLAFA|nr:hypothetical protein PFNF135_02832 [Plasmodium falciparum NF135/5.C10]
MARGPRGGKDEEDPIDETSAKHLLDSIGKIVHKEVKKEAKNYIDDLKGNLNKANNSSEELAAFPEPCDIINDKVVKLIDARDDPCTNLSRKDVKRFSDKIGGQCTKEKISGSTSTCGACAPYRRLHLCHHNLENIKDVNNIDNDTLLAEVCLAAKYEGQSISVQHGQYHTDSSGSTICTVLARSFADIGDIVRGRDLFYGNTHESAQRIILDNNLKKIFKQIHEGLTTTNAKKGQKSAKEYYQDKNGGNFFKLREDWWTANRETVWKALTCDARDNAEYFRKTPCAGTSPTDGQCRCNDNQVPTYFDYVPQFLRWFEEWAEDFCRKRKYKLENAIEKCRGENNEKYCDLNRYDCTETVIGEKKLVEGADCIDCHFSCARFVKWIDNQKLEFLKQKEKYGTEISNSGSCGGSRKKRSATIKYEGYEKEFYEQFKKKGNYGTVEGFLGLLNKEEVCKKNNDIKEGGQINFKNVKSSAADGGDGNNKTFARTKICEPCPWCGTEEKDGKWEPKTETCGKKKDYDRKNITDIPILTPQEQLDIVQKYKKFCASVKDTANGGKGGSNGAGDGSDREGDGGAANRTAPGTATSGENGKKGASGKNGNQIEKWQCYYEKTDKSNNCILGKWENFKQDQKVKPYSVFFWDWVHDMLHDSVEWRKQLGNCINNELKPCKKNKCHGKCDCFLKWVNEKKTEWTNIKEHFGKQGDIVKEGFLESLMTHDVVLEQVLKDGNLLQNIKDVHGDTEDIKYIEELLNEEKKKNQEEDEADASGTGNTSIIDKLLKHEEDEAKKCKEKNPEKCPEDTAVDLGRNLPPSPETPRDTPSRVDQDDEDEEDEDEVEEDTAETQEKTTEQEVDGKGEDTNGDTTEKTVPKGPPETPPEDACTIAEAILKAEGETKYKELCEQKFSGKKKSYPGWNCNSDIFKPGEQEGACMPPRRQKLYLKKLQTFNGQKPDDLRKAFIECAAIETFFAWHKFKKDKQREKKEKEEIDEEGYISLGEKDLQDQLEKGQIPKDFKRQMFYTFGDYRDICLGKDIGRDMEKVDQKLKGVFPNIVQTSTDKQRETWWKEYGKDIWDGMVCALHYDTNDKTIKIDKEVLDKINNNNKYDKQKSKLEEITCTPQFIRWFEEWGDEFCRKKKIKLANVKKECRSHKTGHEYCSGDGYDCTDENRRRNNILADLDCRDCEKECTKFKKWIKTKEKEFDNQKNKYKELISPSNKKSHKEFHNYAQTKGYTSVDIFLKSLNQGKECQGNKDEKKNTDFNNNHETFGSSGYCKACPVYGVSKNRGIYIPNDEKIFKSKKGSAVNKNDTNTTNINVLVSDDKGNDKDEELRNVCKMDDLLKYSGVQKWECQKKNGVDQCKLTNVIQTTDDDDDKEIEFYIFFQRWLRNFIQDYNKLKNKISSCIKNEHEISNKCIKDCNNKCECVGNWLKKKEDEWKKIKDLYKQYSNISEQDIAYWIKNLFRQGTFPSDAKKAKEVVKGEEEQEKLWGCTGNTTGHAQDKCENGDFITNLIKKLTEKIGQCQSKHNGTDCSETAQPKTLDDETLDNDIEIEEAKKNMMPTICKDVIQIETPEEPKKDEICENGSVNCNKHEAYSTSKCKTKTNLIGLGAHYYKGGVDYPNVYVPPRVRQLCLEPLKFLEDNNTNQNKFIEALKKCAYNEAKGLYDYYNNNRNTIGKNDSQLSEKEIEKYILKAMERSYADYGSIVKGDILCDYKDKKNIDPKIINFVKHHNTSTTKTSVSKSDDEDSKREKLWESIRTNIWKAMLCGYKDAGGSFDNHDVQCKLPDTEKTNQLFRWFIEWGENFCIRREQELKQLKEICEKGICNGTDETKKKECKMLCESYKQFLSNSKTQYENQKKEYEDLKYTIPEFMKKDALTFLKEKCNSKYSCFETKDKTDVHKLFKYPSDDVKDKCPCEPAKAPDDPFKDLNECPDENNKYCNKYSTVPCNRKNKEYLLNDWDTTYLLQRTTVNNGVLVPPRRSHICFPNIIGIKPRINSKIHFKEHILNAAGAEAKYLSIKYGNDDNSLLVAMKYSFADIGNIIKGDDMLDDIRSTKVKDIIQRVNSKLEPNIEKLDGKKWWEENRDHVWNVMVCHYKKNNNTCPSHNDIDKEDQFLRWLVEWGRQVCKEKKELKASVYKKCKDKDRKVDESCNYAASSYNNWNTIVKHAYDGLNKKYKNFKLSKLDSTLTKENADEYIKEKCSECQCSFKDIDETFKKTLDTNDDVLDVIINKSHIPPHLEDIFNRYNGPYLHCPDSTLCRPYKNIPCFGNEHDDDGDWNSSLVRYNKTTNWGVLLPPRRIHLCLRIDAEQIDHLRSEIENFKNFICSSAFSEAKRLKRVYDDNDKLLQAIKYSFSDIGSIVKGEDMKEGTASDNIAKIFNGKKFSETNRKKWWNENKYHVWESMLCGYKEAHGDTETSENCRFPDIETVPQFLRWFQEWTEIFCNKRNKLYKVVQSQCSTAICNKKDGSVAKTECTKACEEYKNYVLKKKKEYYIQKDKYDNQFKKVLNNKDAEEFLNVHCLSEYFSEKDKWENPYDTFDDKNIKDKCDCKKIEHPSSILPDARPLPPLNPEVEPPQADEPFDSTILQTTIPFGVALALGSIAFLFLKVKVNIYVWGICSPKYKTLIEVILEPSGNNTTASGKNTPSDTQNDIQNDIQNDGIPSSKITDNEWNTLKHDFISQYLQSEQNTEPNMLGYNVDNNTHPTTSRHTLDQKPFIMSIHDRNLLSGEEYNYDMSTNSGNNNLYSGENNVYGGIDPTSDNRGPYSDKNDRISDNHHPYSGIDLINDALNGDYDIYDEILKRKENELFGTNHVKQTSIHSVAKPTNNDPIHNQLELFHKWLDRHRDMCEKWNNKEELLDKLKEKWENKTHSGDINSGIPSGNHVLNTDVSIQIHMDNPKPINEFSNMDTILEDLDKYNEPYYDVQDDIYYDVNDHDTSTVDSNNMDVPSKVQIEMDVNTKLVKEKYPIADVWDI